MYVDGRQDDRQSESIMLVLQCTVKAPQKLVQLKANFMTC